MSNGQPLQLGTFVLEGKDLIREFYANELENKKSCFKGIENCHSLFIYQVIYNCLLVPGSNYFLYKNKGKKGIKVNGKPEQNTSL